LEEIKTHLAEKLEAANDVDRVDHVSYFSCLYGHIHIVHYLLNEGLLTASGFNGACVGGHLLIVNLLLETQDSVPVDSDDGFVIVCRHGHIDTASRLLNYNPNVSPMDVRSVMLVMMDMRIPWSFFGNL